MRIAIGISGGVDSAVAALILREQGHDLVGVTMTLGREDEEASLVEAKAVAARLDIPLRVLDLSEDWNRLVVRNIAENYRAALTPNPCVRCNEFVKFGLLPRWAFETLGCERFATGHYARLKTDASGRTRLYRALDRSKDQAYFLYRVSPAILERTILPLGEMTKAEVRDRGRLSGFAAAERPDSQDFCGGDVKSLIGLAPRTGNIVRAADGKILGTHFGFWNYTVGMRRGLGIGGGTPYYVTSIDAAHNEVRVGTKEESIRHDVTLTACVGEIDKSLPVKVRSAGEPRLLADGIAGIAPGQSAVFYRGDEIVGGGIIVA